MNKNKKRKVLTIMLALAMVASVGATSVAVNSMSSVSVNAADTLTTEDGFSYEVIDNTNTVCITGYSKNGKIAIPSKIDGKTVVEIRKGAFYGKTGLQSVTIPNTVKTISGSAFSGCTGLQEVDMTMAESLETIGSSAFLNCTALKEIKIPNSVTSIGVGTFENCTALEKVIIGNGVTEIGDWAFNNCTSLSNLTLGSSIEKLGESVFECCENLPDVTLPSSLTEMGVSAFSGCSKLNKITIPNKIKTIGLGTFRNCTNLQEVNMVEGLETIGSSVFMNCTALKEITIPNSVTIIDGGDCFNAYHGAFEGCTTLETVAIGKSLKEIGSNAFKNCKNLTTVTLPNTLEKMGESAFRGCENLKTVVMKGENIYTIPSDAFSDCTSLKDVNIGSGITTVGSSAFGGCTSLEEITLPSSVTKIEGSAFSNCTSLKKIIIPESVTVIQNDVFYKHSKDLVIYGYSNDCEAKKYADANNITYKLINAHDHQPGEWITIKEATDKNSGTQIKKCTICGELLDVKTIDIIHTHTYGDKWQSDETNHWHECAVCGEKADTAKHEFGEWITDEKTGKQHRKCNVCGYTESKTISHVHAYDEKWKSDNKNHWHECSCGDKTDVAEHIFKEVVDKKATKTETGLKHKECTVCGYKTESEIIDKITPEHKHSYGTEWKSDNKNHWHECSCGDKTDVAEHTFKEVVDKKATKTETGLKHKECTVCGYKGENIVIKVDSTPAEIIDNNNNNSNKGTNNNSNNGTNTNTENKSVNTGDSMMPITVASVLGLGAVTVFVVNFKKRKDNHNS